MLAAALLILCANVRPALSALYNHTSELPSGKEYDYIIVGSGTAGGVVGTRLSEDPTKNVLIIEAGGNPDGNINTEVPYFITNNFGSSLDWNFTITPQPGLNNRPMRYPIGKALGGSSTIQFLLYNRGGKDDYDRWANMTGDDSWSWKTLFPKYTNRIEHPSPDSDLSQEWIAADHGTTGPLGITVPPLPLVADSYVINAAKESEEFPYNPDVSSGNSIGIGWATTTMENGTRASTWTHYLRPVISRPNLDIVMNTQVTRILQTGTKNNLPVFQGVEFATSSSSPRGTLTATREVILSAGAILTPQLLMLSGIGDANTLSSLGIPTIINNSNVGQNVQDRPRLSSIYNLVPGIPTLDIYRQNATLRNEEFAVWQKNHTGPLTIASPKQMGFFRIPPDIGAPFNQSDPSAGPSCGHYQLVFADQFSSFVQPAPANGSYFTVIVNVVSSESYGNVTLNSPSPFAPPLINPAIFGSYYDLATMREGIKAGYRFVQSKTLSTDFVVSPFGALADALAGGDEALEEFAMANTTVTWHMTGSARMASKDGSDGVLDSKLNVLGAVGLRVVDASAIPRTPAANTIAPVYILAERAADLIKADAGPQLSH